MYDFAPEKSLRLASFIKFGETFNLAIRLLFTNSSLFGLTGFDYA